MKDLWLKFLSWWDYGRHGIPTRYCTTAEMKEFQNQQMIQRMRIAQGLEPLTYEQLHKEKP